MWSPEMTRSKQNLTPTDIRGMIEDVAGLVAICVLFVAGLGLPLWT